jgi:hypothetical protein
MHRKRRNHAKDQEGVPKRFTSVKLSVVLHKKTGRDSLGGPRFPDEHAEALPRLLCDRFGRGTSVLRATTIRLGGPP